tara:strand:+ start:122 stop:1489 length:1368 start_codon:yes stop_codon:yes gene_type:complete
MAYEFEYDKKGNLLYLEDYKNFKGGTEFKGQDWLWDKVATLGGVLDSEGNLKGKEWLDFQNTDEFKDSYATFLRSGTIEGLHPANAGAWDTTDLRTEGGPQGNIYHDWKDRLIDLSSGESTEGIWELNVEDSVIYNPEKGGQTWSHQLIDKNPYYDNTSWDEIEWETHFRDQSILYGGAEGLGEDDVIVGAHDYGRDRYHTNDDDEQEHYWGSKRQAIELIDWGAYDTHEGYQHIAKLFRDAGAEGWTDDSFWKTREGEDGGEIEYYDFRVGGLHKIADAFSAAKSAETKAQERKQAEATAKEKVETENVDRDLLAFIGAETGETVTEPEAKTPTELQNVLGETTTLDPISPTDTTTPTTPTDPRGNFDLKAALADLGDDAEYWEEGATAENWADFDAKFSESKSKAEVDQYNAYSKSIQDYYTGLSTPTEHLGIKPATRPKAKKGWDTFTHTRT